MAKCQSNQVEREFMVGKGGGFGTLSWSRGRVREAHLVFFQFANGAEGCNRGSDKEIIIGTWSEPVLGKWVNHDEKKGANAILTNEISSPAGLSAATNGKCVNTPGLLRREKPTSAALSKYGVEIATSWAEYSLRGSESGL